jgi:hypothetical protein
MSKVGYIDSEGMKRGSAMNLAAASRHSSSSSRRRRAQAVMKGQAALLVLTQLTCKVFTQMAGVSVQRLHVTAAVGRAPLALRVESSIHVSVVLLCCLNGFSTLVAQHCMVD